MICILADVFHSAISKDGTIMIVMVMVMTMKMVANVMMVMYF